MSRFDGSWIDWFVGLPANEFLCRVPNDFARDRFNMTGLETIVPNYYDTLETILDSEFDTESHSYEINNATIDPDNLEQLYGMIHARYIMTQRGIADMCVKYTRGDFGICPRVNCESQLVLPVGLTDRPCQSHVKVYCARCQDVYEPDARCALLDGAMFGSSFPHMFFMQLPKLLPEPPVKNYYPSVYGFKVHKSALMPPGSGKTDTKIDKSSTRTSCRHY